jgi:hypothetical protein
VFTLTGLAIATKQVFFVPHDRCLRVDVSAAFGAVVGNFHSPSLKKCKSSSTESRHTM